MKNFAKHALAFLMSSLAAFGLGLAAFMLIFYPAMMKHNLALPYPLDWYVVAWIALLLGGICAFTITVVVLNPAALIATLVRPHGKAGWWVAVLQAMCINGILIWLNFSVPSLIPALGELLMAFKIAVFACANAGVLAYGAIFGGMTKFMFSEPSEAEMETSETAE